MIKYIKITLYELKNEPLDIFDWCEICNDEKEYCECEFDDREGECYEEW